MSEVNDRLQLGHKQRLIYKHIAQLGGVHRVEEEREYYLGRTVPAVPQAGR